MPGYLRPGSGAHVPCRTQTMLPDSHRANPDRTVLLKIGSYSAVLVRPARTKAANVQGYPYQQWHAYLRAAREHWIGLIERNSFFDQTGSNITLCGPRSWMRC